MKLAFTENFNKEPDGQNSGEKCRQHARQYACRKAAKTAYGQIFCFQQGSTQDDGD